MKEKIRFTERELRLLFTLIQEAEENASYKRGWSESTHASTLQSIGDKLAELLRRAERKR